MVSLLFRWFKIALINLVIVASLGVILRYKILYPLPFVDQKYLLHGHSHFAFAGWVTQLIMIFMVAYLVNQKGNQMYKKYRWLLIANLATAYGMLFTFPFQGYGLYSIIFATASIFVSYIFAVYYWCDLNKITDRTPAHLWFKAAVLFNALSSLGAFALSGMMLAKVIHQNWYLSAEYFFLHFQYNGWFYFACMGLFTAFMARLKVPIKSLTAIFWLFALAAIPAYFLSALWMPIPLWVYILVVLAACAQVIGWVWLIRILKKYWPLLKTGLNRTACWLMGLSAMALSIKLFLQVGSTIPSLSTLAYGFRPIVIGYLHLVFLGVTSLFLLGYLFNQHDLDLNKSAAKGTFIFAGAVILNELLLMVQGVAAISYTEVPFINEMLLGAAVLLFTGAFLMSFAKRKKFQK